MKKKKALIYFYHCQSFGHARRVLNLAKTLKNSGYIEPIIVSGGELPFLINSFREFEFIQLPALIPESQSFYNYKPKHGHSSLEEMISLRSKLLRVVAQELKPDTLILEMFPIDRLGLESEFLSLIESVKEFSPSCKIFSSIRDIPETDNSYWKKDLKKIESYLPLFDAVLVHGEKKIFDYAPFFPNSDASKFIYTGYIVNESFMAGSKDDKNLYLVSVGGGKDAEQIIQYFLDHKEVFFRASKKWTFALGGYCPSSSLVVQDLMSEVGIEILHGQRLEENILSRAKVHLCMGGYNTMVESHAQGLIPIVLPRSQGEEQKHRAIIWQKQGLCHLIDPLDHSTKIESLLMGAYLPVNEKKSLNLEGAEVFLKTISDQLSQVSFH